MVARAQSGDYFTPWSAPITITMIAPFDLLATSFPDSRGPSYQLKGTVREKTMAGSRVTVTLDGAPRIFVGLDLTTTATYPV